MTLTCPHMLSEAIQILNCCSISAEMFVPYQMSNFFLANSYWGYCTITLLAVQTNWNKIFLVYWNITTCCSGLRRPTCHSLLCCFFKVTQAKRFVLKPKPVFPVFLWLQPVNLTRALQALVESARFPSLPSQG